MKILPASFDGQSIRRVFDEATETWWFSVIDVVQVLTESKSARRYWLDPALSLNHRAQASHTFSRHSMSTIKKNFQRSLGGTA